MEKGFTLIEILISIAIIGIISSIFVFSFQKEIQEKKMNSIVNSIVAKLQEAKGLSQSGKDGEVYGIKFNSDSYVTFVGSNYDQTSNTNVVFDIDDNFIISNTIPNADDFVTFSKIKGDTGINANVIITNKNDANMEKIITIRSLGDISVIQ